MDIGRKLSREEPGGPYSSSSPDTRERKQPPTCECRGDVGGEWNSFRARG